MFAHLLALAGDRTPSAPLPQASALLLTPSAGFCNFDSVGEHASINLVFSVTNQAEGYELRLLESGVLLDTLAVSDTEYDYPTPGDVEDAGENQQEYTFNFALQIVRTADGVVVQEVTATYTSTYGICR